MWSTFERTMLGDRAGVIGGFAVCNDDGATLSIFGQHPTPSGRNYLIATPTAQRPTGDLQHIGWFWKVRIQSCVLHSIRRNTLTCTRFFGVNGRDRLGVFLKK